MSAISRSKSMFRLFGMESYSSRREILRIGYVNGFRPKEQKPRAECSQDDNFRIDQVPIANLRMGEIKDQWIDCQDEQIRESGITRHTKGLPDAHQHQHSQAKRQENIAGVMEFNVPVRWVEVPERGPHVNKSSQAHHSEKTQMLGDESDGLAPLFLHKTNFAEPHIFVQ